MWKSLVGMLVLCGLANCRGEPSREAANPPAGPPQAQAATVEEVERLRREVEALKAERAVSGSAVAAELRAAAAGESRPPDAAVVVPAEGERPPEAERPEPQGANVARSASSGRSDLARRRAELEATFVGVSGAVMGLGEAMEGAAGTGATRPDAAVEPDPAAAGSPGQPAVEPATGPSSPATAAPNDSTPPPPPDGHVRSAGAQHAGGSGRWSGDIFRAKLDRKRAAIEGCYDAALVRVPTAVGELIFLLTVNQVGDVTVEVESDDPDLAAAGVTACVLAKLRSLNFTDNPPQGGETRVRLPFTFSLE